MCHRRGGGSRTDSTNVGHDSVPPCGVMAGLPRTYRRFVAIGDSFTEGLDDPYPNGTLRGWADRFAEILAETNPGLEYANLAVRGRKVREIVDHQVPAALAMHPDLVSLAGGINDVLRPSVDVDDVAALMRNGVETIRASGADVLLTCFGDPSRRSFLLGRVAARLGAYRHHVLSIAKDHDCFVMDFWGVPIFDDARFWAADRLHLSPAGHALVAHNAADALQIGDSAWRTPPPPEPPMPWLQRRREDGAWVAEYLGPWLTRRLRGGSSGEGVEPKRPTLSPVKSTSSTPHNMRTTLG